MFLKKVSLDDLNFDKNLEINNEIYDLKVNLYNKKNSSIIVKDNVLDIRLSSYLRKKDAQNHLDSLINKIALKLAKQEKSRVFSFSDAVKRGYFYLGSIYFELVLDETKKNFSFKENVFYLPKSQRIDILEKKVILSLCTYFKDYVEYRVVKYNENTYNYKFGKVDLKLVKSKWGHCTYKNDLLFNIKLLNMPDDVFDYVIAHELSHIRFKDHSVNFWNEVSRFCPNYKKLRKYLKDNSVSLFDESSIR